MTWEFYINNIQIDEPLGFSDLVIRARRDENWHGVVFEASTSDLTFYGDAARYLQNLKNLHGFDADATFNAKWACDDGNDVLTGRLDFRRYREGCGNECLVTLPVEHGGCLMTLKNRYDQKVDLSKTTSFDGVTNLQEYDGLNFQMELPAQESREAVEGSVDGSFDLDFDVPMLSQDAFNAIRPSYDSITNNTINQGGLESFNNLLRNNIDVPDPPLTPQLLLDDEINCFDGDFEYRAVFDGWISFYSNPSVANTILTLKAKIVTWDANGNFFDDSVLVDEVLIASGVSIGSIAPNVVNFNEVLSGTTPITNGFGLYAYIEFVVEGGGAFGLDVESSFTSDTYFSISALKSCPPTDAVVSLVHETASRITEAITDVCLKVKSDYYGRTDSEPYAASADGCGSLRVLSSGLRIRNAENPTHFLSLKELFEGLNGIDNIGMGIEGNWLRIEPVEYFYRDEEILPLPLVPKATFSLDPDKAYSIIRVGYKKWETEGVNGLDEFNSNKEFRTSLANINNTLDVTSGFVAGGYPIEITRQQSYAESGGADTKYDNDTFIICVKRGAYTFEVEQGNIDLGINMFSPSTAYNWRIRPFYNLMRWWKSIAQSYAVLTNSTSRLYFSAGTGNLLAEGELPSDPCKLENKPKSESDDLFPGDFAETNLPIYKPERATFTYPLSLKDFNLIKDNPHGFINIQCGNGDFVKGFIIDLSYKPAKGEADITLRLKWGTQS